MKKAFTFSELMISLVVISILAAILYPTVAQFTPNSNKPLFKSAYKILTMALSSVVNDSEDGELPLCQKPNATNPATRDHRPANNNTADNCEDAKNGNEYIQSAYALCMAMCERMNVLPKTNAAGQVTTCTGNNNICTTAPANVFTTTNGMRWKFTNLTGDNVQDPFNNTAGNNLTDVFIIAVDVNAKNNDQVPTNVVACAGTPYEFVNASCNGVFHYSADATANTGIYTNLANRTFSADNLRNQDTFIFAVDRQGHIISMSPAGYANLEDEAQD